MITMSASSSNPIPQSSTPPAPSNEQSRCQKIYDELVTDLWRRLPKSKKERRNIPKIKYMHLFCIVPYLILSYLYRGEQLSKFELAARLIPQIIDMFAPIRAVITAGLLQDGVWLDEGDEDDAESSDDEELGGER
jgi:hypothetical protein